MAAAEKSRADVLLVERGLAVSRQRAQAMILAGAVFVGEQRVEKAGDTLRSDVELEVRGNDNPFVSRGGLKLAGALKHFGYSPSGKVCADFGASTGGFTDCILQNGAARVYAIDVGYGQLHERLRQDDRVVNMERTNARHLHSKSLPEPVDLVVMDCSFISIYKLLPAVVSVLQGPDGRTGKGDFITLIKPQFEVGKHHVGKGGVVRDEEVRQRAIDAVIVAARELGFHHHGTCDSPIHGPKGNLESLAYLSLEEPV